jgi:hypothetical protein
METILEGLDRFGNQPVMETILEGLKGLEYRVATLGLTRLLDQKGRQPHSARRPKETHKEKPGEQPDDQGVRRHRRSEIPRRGSQGGPAVRCS